MKIFVSAGEVSGDEILGAVLKRLRERIPTLILKGLGGPSTQAQGLLPLFPLESTAVSGAWDVLRKAFFLFRVYRTSRDALRDFRPDLVLLVDYPGLNMRLAAQARAAGRQVYYLAPPQTWVYRNQNRRKNRTLRALQGCSVHVLFPFEAELYSGTARKVTVGHFLVSGSAPRSPRLAGRRILCLCPGSRLPVWQRNLPIWLNHLADLKVLSERRDLQGVEVQVLMPSHLQAGVHSWLQEFRQGRYVQSVTIRTDKDAALAEADWALVFPGTLTLELALYRVPMVILAVLDPLTLRVGTRLLRSNRLGLPNLLLQEDVFLEWAGVAADLTKEKLQSLLQGLWNWNRDWEPLQQRLETVLGEGNGAANVAEECLHILEASH